MHSPTPLEAINAADNDESKIHRARVTEACIDYEGSITIDSSLLEAADIIEYEQVHIYNISNGERFITYVIKGEAGSA